MSEPGIIGAGPAGLAVAAGLGRRGVPYRLLDAGDAVGASWHHRYDSLRLHTVSWLSGLPGMPIPKAYGRWVGRDDLVAYLRAYAAEHQLVPELGVEATRVEPHESGWRVHTSAGPVDGAAVVVASGYSHTPWTPDWPGRSTFAGPVVHSAAYREPSPYRDLRVLVVGSGNSAADLVVDLAGVAAEVIMAVRTPPNIIRRDSFGIPSQLIGIASDRLPPMIKNPMTGLLRTLTVPDLSAYGLPAAHGGYSQFLRSQTVPILDWGFVDVVRSGQVRIVPAVQDLTEGGARLVDGRTVEVDAVIAATGYRPGLEPLVGHLGVLGPGGLPLVSGGRTLPQAPRLHFLGIKVELTGLLREIRIEAARIARARAGSA